MKKRKQTRKTTRRNPIQQEAQIEITAITKQINLIIWNLKYIKDFITPVNQQREYTDTQVETLKEIKSNLQKILTASKDYANNYQFEF